MSLRHHLASLGAVLLALAVGLVAGAASGAGAPGAGGAGVAGERATPVPAASAAAPPSGADADRLLAESVPVIVAGSMGGRTVAVLALGEDAVAAADTAAADLAAAGATAPVRATVDASWADPAGAALRDGLARQLGAEPAEGVDPLAVLLAAAITGDGGPAEASPATVWGVLTGAGLLSGVPDSGSAPEALVVVAPAEAAPPAVAGWAGLVQSLAASAPVVLAAPSPTGEAAGRPEGSVVVTVRDSPARDLLSTVDHADTGVGRLAVVRTTAALPAGPRGHYGSLRGAASGAPDRG
jgi:hypothetical protein